MSSPLQLPPLYFQDKGCWDISLPAEVLHKCLADYASWGDLAKLSCVQSAWKNSMYDAALCNPKSQWKLACALLEGSDGLISNPTQAMLLLHQLVLALVEVHPITKAPIFEVRSTMKNNSDSDSDSSLSNNETSEFATKAMKKLAFLYLEDDETQVETETSPNASTKTDTGLAWLQCAFEAGNDVDAAHELALIYEYGRFHVPSDPVAAAKYFEKAACRGHVEAMAELALCYELGCGVEASDETALDWYMKAAVAGHVTAQFSIGEAFEEARGVPQSDAEACLWYYKAAVEGDEDSRKALRRLEDVARIVVPGVRALLLLSQ